MPLPSVTRPRVPSDPTNTLLRLYPAEDFLGRRLVLMTVPSASTTVRLITQSFIVPYLTAFVPEQLVPTIPPILAVGPRIATGQFQLHLRGNTGRARDIGVGRGSEAHQDRLERTARFPSQPAGH